MVKILSLLVLTVLLFVGGLGAALYLRPPAEADDAGNTAEGVVPGATGGDGGADPVTELPVAFRGRPMSTDEIFRFTASIRARERELKRRAETMDQRESRLKMQEEDLRGQRREIDGLMEELQSVHERGKSVLAEVVQERAALNKERSKATQELNKVKDLHQAADANETSNIKQISEWLENMPEEIVADYLKQLVNKGQIQMAVRLLAYAEGRNVAKFLSAIPDQDLVVQLTQEFTKYQRPIKKK